MPDQSNTLDNFLCDVRNIIREIEEKSVSGDYIYRGEPEHHEESPYYGKICSSLYRQYARIEADEFDIEIVQEEILAEAGGYSHETDDPIEILTQLQHYGGKTNLIDFTTDHLIALFFACDGSTSYGKDGRLILLQKTEERKEYLLSPRNPQNRVIAQKSIFIQHPDGFLSPDDVDIITIPGHLKQQILGHLKKYHGVSTETIYNDLHGFITNQSIHESAYTEFYRGLTYQLEGDKSQDTAEKQAAYEKAIVHYTRALELKPDLPEVYTNRGNVYRDIGELDKAIVDYNSATELDPNDANAYNNRGNAYFDKNEIDKAIEDYNTAIELKPDYDDAYYNRGNAYHVKGNITKAIEDYNKAVELDFNLAEAYVTRGIAWLHLQEWEKAKTDLAAAKGMGLDIIAEFHNTYGYETAADFERDNDVTLPEEIAAMLVDP